MNCGSGTNTRGELFASLVLLWVSQLYQVSNLQVFGDSKVIIDWVTNKSCLQVLSMDPKKIKIQELLSDFLQVVIKHTFWEYNQEVYLL